MSSFNRFSRTVVICRGPSGSGKSHYATEVMTQHLRDMKDPDKPLCMLRILSTDNEFVNPETGKYEFEPFRLGEAHSNCLNKFIYALRQAESSDLDWTVIVDNTNIREWEYQNYRDLAKMAGWNIVYHETMTRSDRVLDSHIDEWASRNVHGVPREVIAKMVRNFEPRTLYRE